MRLLFALRQLVGVVATAALVGAGGSAFGAQQDAYAWLTEVQGTVLVDSGSGFTRVVEDVGLRLGDRVMVTDGGGALLSFSNDCALPLQAPSMTTVTQTACVTSTQGGGEEGEGTGTGGAAIVGIGILGVGGTVLIMCLTQFCDESPDSP